MTLYINKFIDRVQGQEARGAKDLVMTIGDAKNLHADITRLLLELQRIREQIPAPTTDEQIITVKMSGGSF